MRPATCCESSTLGFLEGIIFFFGLCGFGCRCLRRSVGDHYLIHRHPTVY